MAFDGKGKYHMSPHHAKMADGFQKHAAVKEPEDGEEVGETKPGPDGETEDGTEVAGMLEKLHEAHGGKHMHVHAHEAGVTTHHIGDDGVVEGPHEHPDMQSAADHMHMVMGEGAGAAEPQAPMHSGHPMMAGY